MIQPASIDIHLGHSFRVFHNHRIQSIDLGNPPRDLTEHVEVEDGGEFVIHPGEFVLGRTHELVGIPDDIVTKINGEVRRMFADQEFHKSFLERQFFESIAGAPEQLTSSIRAEEPRWRKVISDAKVRPE